jgi:hypothetical protein
MIVTGLDMVGAAMHHRFLQEGKPGFTMRSGSSYSTWWNGGLRTTAYFQNIIGLLTEIIGNPTPSQIPPTRPDPAARRSAGADRAAGVALPPVDRLLGDGELRVLDLASRYKDQFLYNIYKMGSNQIERGSQRSLDDLERRHDAAAGGDGVRRAAGGAQPAAGGGGAAAAAGAAPGAGRRRQRAGADRPGGGGRGGRGA